MPSECTLCLKLHANEQVLCSKCGGHCHSWRSPDLIAPSKLSVIKLKKPKNALFLSGISKGVHFKKLKSDKTQRRYKGQIKTVRQSITLNRGLLNINAGRSVIVAAYGNGGAEVQIHMVLSSHRGGKPSFFGVKRDGSVHPRVPNDPVIPEQFRDDVEDYDSSDDEAA